MKKYCKKVLWDIFLIILFGFLCLFFAKKGEKTGHDLQIQNKKTVVISEEGGKQEDGEVSWNKELEMYQMLDALLENAFQKEERDELIQDWEMEQVKKPKENFVFQTIKNSSFPEELVIKLEEVLYNSDAAKMEEPGSPYQEMIQEMGGKEYLMDMEDLYSLFPKLDVFKEKIRSVEDACMYLEHCYLTTPPACLHVFHLSMEEGQDNYIFAWAAAKVSVRVTERNGDDFTFLTEFGTTNDKEGRVVRYKDDFYYVFLYNTFNGKDYDGIGICHLTGDWDDMLSIRYQPDTYVWEKLFAADESLNAQEKMDAYIERMEKTLSFGNYLGVKGDFHESDVYFGDEVRSEFIMVSPSDADGSGAAYQVDLANCGMPVYVWKEHDQSNSLQVRFYYYDTQSGSYVELANACIDGNGGNDSMDLVQMWFKEVEGKVYTFQLYYVSDYSYILKIILLEKNNVKTVRTYLLSPEKEFILEEKN